MQPDTGALGLIPTGRPSADQPDTEVIRLNARFHGCSATSVLRAVLRLGVAGRRVAMVSSFGAESVALLHLVAQADPETPVLFLDTGRLFAETLRYQQEVAAHLGLRNVILRAPDAERLAHEDPYGALHLRDADACCALRKTDVLSGALARFDGWITGRKRFQSDTRSALDLFERDPADSSAQGRIKINPLAHWTSADLARYIAAHDLPRHPLVARGYPSVGCAPCTRPVADGKDPRSGRWPGQTKTECGLHPASRAVTKRLS